MHAIAHLPEEKRALLEALAGPLSAVQGMQAVVLGGSYASHHQHATSDLDIGLYYREDQPFAIADIRRIANGAAADGNATVTGFYEWGAWVNGGAWIHTRRGKVDFLYRNLDQVQRTLDEARQGILHHDYDQQPTHGFFSVIYLAETQICSPLFDPHRHIESLKRQVETYPPELKRRIILDGLWSGEFTLLHAREFAAQGDVYNTVGCLTRIASNLTQVLFAINERYFIRDKRVMQVLDTFPILPEGYVTRVEQILAQSGSTAVMLAQSVVAMEQVWRSVVLLTDGLYQPKFQL